MKIYRILVGVMNWYEKWNWLKCTNIFFMMNMVKRVEFVLKTWKNHVKDRNNINFKAQRVWTLNTAPCHSYNRHAVVSACLPLPTFVESLQHPCSSVKPWISSPCNKGSETLFCVPSSPVLSLLTHTIMPKVCFSWQNAPKEGTKLPIKSCKQ